jgi:hypothetical protein
MGNYNCCVDQTTIQNVQSCNYTLQNYFAQDCSMKNPIALATTQPCVFYNGGHNSGAGGCNIDDSSRLLIGSVQTHPRCRIDLYQRPFATVPYLGRGAVDPALEAQIQQGELSTNKRSINQLGEQSFMKYSATPLIPSIKDKITNPTNLVEGAAAQGWIRGGVPSRELTRDKDYYDAHTNEQYV